MKKGTQEVSTGSGELAVACQRIQAVKSSP